MTFQKYRKFGKKLSRIIKNEMIHVVKNRFGSDNKQYHIDTVKELFVKEYREKKLKRILKIS